MIGKGLIVTILCIGFNNTLYAQDSVRVYRTFDTKNSNKQGAGNTFQQIPGMVYDYQKHLAPACKAELYLEKATKIPLRFRVGSIEQSDYLEQKPNAKIYNR